MNNKKQSTQRDAQLNALRQRELKARRASQGLYKVNGLFAPKEHHKAIKEFAASLQNSTSRSRA